MGKIENVGIHIIGIESEAQRLLNALKREDLKLRSNDLELLNDLAVNGHRYVHFKEIGGNKAVGVFRPPLWDGGKMGVNVTETGRVSRVDVSKGGSFDTVLESTIGLADKIVRSSVVVFVPGVQTVHSKKDGVPTIGTRVNDAVGFWMKGARIGFQVDEDGIGVTDIYKGLHDDEGRLILNAYGYGDGFGSESPEVAAAVIASQLAERRERLLARAG